MRAISELLSELRPDPWREQNGFSSDIISAHDQIFGHSPSDEAISSTLNDWIAKYQPCLFGKIAARLGLISYCVLSESDLSGDDSYIQDKIQKARLRWLQEGAAGDKSAFVILVVSKKISLAIPDDALFRLAQRICELYLLRAIDKDKIYLDSLELNIPGKTGSRRRWDVGVNYFSSQADQRWWHDHRIPGGLAFSMNSVGHLAMSGKVAGAMRDFENAVSIDDEGWRHSSIDSLEKALVYAMRTIASASAAVSGKATELLDITEVDRERLPKCPIELPNDLSGKNHCEYIGFYHTDITLPAAYFLSDVERPTWIESRPLDFSYIFDADIKNPDYINVGLGRQVREWDLEENLQIKVEQRLKKTGRSFGYEIPEEDC